MHCLNYARINVFVLFYRMSDKRHFKEKEHEDHLAMSQRNLLNALFLCAVNTLFMIAGIFLNSVVIISLWRSQIGKKPCYFMIRILSCFDLVVVTVTHPLLLLSTITMYLGDVSELRETIRLHICILLQGFSMISLFVLNMERFLAITYPFFYKRVVTKQRLLSCLAVMLFLMIVKTTLSYYEIEAAKIVIYVCAPVFMSLFVYLNYKMFVIAKSKQAEDIIVLGSEASGETKKAKRFVSFKRISTCSLVVVCSFICFCPGIVYSVLCWECETPFHEKQLFLLGLWADTSFSLSSTFNCLIFFWRNTVLRREGMKIIKCCREQINGK